MIVTFFQHININFKYKALKKLQKTLTILFLATGILYIYTDFYSNFFLAVSCILMILICLMEVMNFIELSLFIVLIGIFLFYTI